MISPLSILFAEGFGVGLALPAGADIPPSFSISSSTAPAGFLFGRAER